jgi:hypothetical protein
LKVKKLPELMTEIKCDYDKDPYNWRILRGKDSNQHMSTFIAHDDKKLWQLKTEWKNPVMPIGIGKCVKRNLNDEIQELMKTGTDLPIHEIYPDKDNFIIALGYGKYSLKSTNRIRDLLFQDVPGYKNKIEKELNLEFRKILSKEQLFKHYI